MVTTLTTTQAAHLLGVDVRSFRRWARAHRVEPKHRVRIGRSWVTVWDRDALAIASVIDVTSGAC